MPTVVRSLLAPCRDAQPTFGTDDGIAASWRPVRSIALALVMLAASTIAIGANVAHSAEIKLMAANAVKEGLLELADSFEQSSRHKVTSLWSRTTGVAKRIGSGEVVDIVLIGSADIDKLISQGKLVAGSRSDFARAGVGIAVRAGLPKPDVSSRDAIRKAVLAAKSIAYSSGPSGYYIADLLKAMDIADQVQHKVKQPPSGVAVADLLARGEADLGFQQVSELLHAKGIDYLGPLPADIQNITVYSTGLHTAAPAAEAARAFVKFITSPVAGPVLKKIGMEPG